MTKWKTMKAAVTAAAIAATQVLAAMPALAAETETDTDYVYGTVNLPYADYYYGELYDVTEDATMQLDAEDAVAALRAEGYCDAVTSATNTKSVKYSTTYYTKNEDGSVTVEGIGDVAIAVPKALYEAATAALEDGLSCNNALLSLIGSMSVNADQTTVPVEYKILNGDGTLTAMIDANEAITVDDATVAVQTNTTYGNYQLSITGADDLLPDSDNMEGVVLTMSDGSRYALLHVDNLWLRTGEIAWAVEDGYLVHNANVLKYKSFSDTVGKTITSVRYIIRDSADVTFVTESYLPVLHEGTASAEDTAADSGSISLALSAFPEDYVPAVTVSNLDTTYDADGTLTYDATGAMPGSYSITVADENGVYAPVSATVTLTTDETPAIFDAATQALVAAEGAADADFANYLSNISSVSVDGVSYSASGKGATKIIDSATGALDLTVTTRENTAIFGTTGTYEITVSATGYTEDLTFSLTLGTEEAFATGDVDGDGTVDISDASLILSYYANQAVGNTDFTLSDAAMAVADVDGNDVIDIADASYVLNYYAMRAAGLQVEWEDLLGA